MLLEEVRSIDLGLEWKWDIKFIPLLTQEAFPNFVPPPPPFLLWFPAINVRMGVESIQTQVFETAVGLIQIPQNTNLTDMNILFVDDANGAIVYWLKQWFNQITANGQGIRTVSEIARGVLINKNDHNNILKDFYQKSVFPKGELVENFTSDPKVRLYSQDFAIVGSL